MGQRRLRQASTYIADEEYAELAHRARRRSISVSEYLKSLINNDRHAVQQAEPDGLTTSLNRLHIAVDALVKHHPNDKLFGIVRATQREKCGSRSDEA